MPTQSIFISLLRAISLHLLTFLVVLPYAQDQVNSHMDAGNMLGVLVASLTIINFSVDIIQYRKSANRSSMFISLIVNSLMTYWVHSLFTLQCMGCLNAG